MMIYLDGKLWLANISAATNFKTRFFGYMFQKAPQTPAILFDNCNSIHMFFMHFSIDVLFLDKEMTVLKKVENLSRRKMIWPVKNACYVLEAPAGRLGLAQVGDRLQKRL